jgi:hypothetical protein
MHMTPSAYISLLNSLRCLGYASYPIEQIEPGPRQLFLRHDVDLDLGFAADMAELEARAGYQSTYYVMLDSDFYNLFSPHSSSCIRRILDFGHAIGLHLDPGRFSGPCDELDAKAAKELGILESIIGRRVNSLSFHRPVPALQNVPLPVADRPHTYMPRYFSQMRYFSDSGGSFRFGLPLDDAAVRSCSPLQLLTHPIWWFQEGANTDEKLIRFRARCDARVHGGMLANLKPYASMAERGLVS